MSSEDFPNVLTNHLFYFLFLKIFDTFFPHKSFIFQRIIQWFYPEECLFQVEESEETESLDPHTQKP